MLGFPNKPMAFPTQNDHFGVWNADTSILGNLHIIYIYIYTLHSLKLRNSSPLKNRPKRRPQKEKTSPPPRISFSHPMFRCCF